MESLPIELAMYEALKKWETAEKAKEYISRYDLAKSILNKDILPWIRTTEPNLSDHGSDHIENVLNNAYKLIEPAIKGLLLCDVTKDQPNFSHLDLYFLCQSILFHDVGNLFGRDNHNQTACKIINEKFSSIFPRTGSHKKQRKIIISAGRAHTGKNTEGRKDTLKDLEVHENFNGNKISLRDIATILRFADELAEGPQRTSSYLLQIGAFSEESTIYHQYADSIELYIDPLNERISLFYEVELSAIEGDGLTKDQTEKVQELLKLIYIRIALYMTKNQHVADIPLVTAFGGAWHSKEINCFIIFFDWATPLNSSERRQSNPYLKMLCASR